MDDNGTPLTLINDRLAGWQVSGIERLEDQRLRFSFTNGNGTGHICWVDIERPTDLHEPQRLTLNDDYSVNITT